MIKNLKYDVISEIEKNLGVERDILEKQKKCKFMASFTSSLLIALSIFNLRGSYRIRAELRIPIVKVPSSMNLQFLGTNLNFQNITLDIYFNIYSISIFVQFLSIFSDSKDDHYTYGKTVHKVLGIFYCLVSPLTFKSWSRPLE